MFDARLRPIKDRVLTPVAAALGDRVAPNTISMLALAPGLGAAWAAWTQHPAIALLLWALNRLLDGLDGTVARRTGRASDFGGVLDLVLDFVVYAAIPIGALAGRGGDAWWALTALLAAFYVNAAAWMSLSAVLEKRGAAAAMRGEATSVAMPAGLVGGAETIAAYTILLAWPAGAHWVAWLLTAAVLFSAAQQVRAASRLDNGRAAAGRRR